MKWEDVIQACKNLGYSPEDLVEMIQVHERGKEYSFLFTKYDTLECTKEGSGGNRS